MHSGYRPVPTASTHPSNVSTTMTSTAIPLDALGPDHGIRKRNPSTAAPDMEEEYLEPSASLPRRPKGAQHKPQYDSGVSDMDSFHPTMESSPYPNGGIPQGRPHGTLTSPKKVPRPDSVATKGSHLYEELPARYANPQYGYDANKGTRGSPMSTFSKSGLNNSSENLCQTTSHSNLQLPAPPQHHSVIPATLSRKRQNPLYEEGPSNDLVKPSGGSKLFRCPCLGMLLLALLCIITLTLLVLVILGFFTPEQVQVIEPETGALSGGSNESELQYALERLTLLEGSYRELSLKYQEVSGNLSNVQEIMSHQAIQLVQLSNELSRVESDMAGDIASLQNSVNSQFEGSNSLVGPPGPEGIQGPPGVGNLSQCQHHMIQSGSSDQMPYTQTAWWPQEDSLDLKMMGLECSTDVGTSSMVRTQDHPDHEGVTQFRCECRGSLNVSAVRYCQLHVWHCPIIS